MVEVFPEIELDSSTEVCTKSPEYAKTFFRIMLLLKDRVGFLVNTLKRRA